MSYIHPQMPPVIRVTSENQDNSIEVNLETQDGTVVATYTTSSGVNEKLWWDGVVAALLDSQSAAETAHDMIRLNAMQDEEYIDER